MLDLLQSLGVKTLIARDTFSSYLTSFLMPEGKSYDALHDNLKENGFTIYAGQGNFSGKIFRIAVMGDIRENEMESLLKLLRQNLA